MNTTRTRSTWLENEDPELKRAWATFSDPVQDNHGERLQYMGTEWRASGWSHCFRHRCDLATGQREYHRVMAADGWTPKEDSRS